ncbi:MAG: hypothetical protein KBC78_00700 [Candidatus Pacebacteria bacterium]|nr:hypothetical protein [Candidatus Paceibacterota bacterium]
MVPQHDSRVIGAFVIGLAVVAGAYTVNNMTEKTIAPNQQASLTTIEEAPERTLIAVQDSNSDGIEDWQDQFLTAEPIVIKREITDYAPPATLTGQVAINFMQNYISGKANGFGPTDEQLVKKTVDGIKNEARDRIYTIRDIDLAKDSSTTTVKNYGNAVANAILDNATAKKTRSEMTIMVDIVNNNEVTDKDIEDLNLVAKMYKGTLEDTLSISVPKEFAKEHLDLINVYNALYHDVLGLTELINDPVKALIRVKRYQDDVVGLTIAMENMYRALDKAAYVFQTSDNATLFANFAPNISKP